MMTSICRNDHDHDTIESRVLDACARSRISSESGEEIFFIRAILEVILEVWRLWKAHNTFSYRGLDV